MGGCTVFDLSCDVCGDHVTLPDGTQHGGSDCPIGVVLATGDTIAWASDGSDQGSTGPTSSWAENGCATKVTCGRPFSHRELGGGWEICFA